MKKDCPNGAKGAKQDSKKVSKVKTVRDADKQETGEKLGVDSGKPDNSRASSGSPPTTKAEEVADKPQGRDATAELLSEATSLLKALRSVKVLRLKELNPQSVEGCETVALLDGGATNGLRQARPHEVPRLLPVMVELASGSTTLFRVKDTVPCCQRTASR